MKQYCKLYINTLALFVLGISVIIISVIIYLSYISIGQFNL